MRLWHYTSREALPLILTSGYLDVSETNLHWATEHAAPDAVWLLDDPDLSVYKHGLDQDTYLNPPDKTAVLIEVDVPDARVRSWVEFAEANQINAAWMQQLMMDAGGRDGAQHWKLVFRRIPREQWTRITVRDVNGEWRDHPLDLDGSAGPPPELDRTLRA